MLAMPISINLSYDMVRLHRRRTSPRSAEFPFWNEKIPAESLMLLRALRQIGLKR